MNIWDNFPQLAAGSFSRDSGQGCVMNIISYTNGDKEITDMPSCTHPAISKLMQRLNDGICKHTEDKALCSDCSAEVLGYAPLIIGTQPPTDPEQQRRLIMSMCVSIRHLVEPHNSSTVQVYDAIQGYLDGTKTLADIRQAKAQLVRPADAAAAADADAAAAAAAADYAYDYAYAADAAADAAAAAAAAAAAYDYAYDYAYAAYAYAYADARLKTLKEIIAIYIKTYYEFMGREIPTIPIEPSAIERLLEEAADNGADFCRV